jgi:hypothetical protein
MQEIDPKWSIRAPPDTIGNRVMSSDGKTPLAETVHGGLVATVQRLFERMRETGNDRVHVKILTIPLQTAEKKQTPGMLLGMENTDAFMKRDYDISKLGRTEKTTIAVSQCDSFVSVNALITAKGDKIQLAIYLRDTQGGHGFTVRECVTTPELLRNHLSYLASDWQVSVQEIHFQQALERLQANG